MSVRVQLPPILRPVMGGVRSVEAEGTSVAEVLDNLAGRFPGLALHLYDESGQIRRNVLFLHEGKAVRPFEAAAHRLGPNDEIVVTNALAGG
jgi:molybdopterin converting factor small subunit